MLYKFAPKNRLVTAFQVICPKKMACTYFSDTSTNVASTSFTISPKTVQHFSDIYQNWPVNACLTPSHNYPMHTFLFSHYYYTVYSVVWSQRQRVTPLVHSSKCCTSGRRIANYFNLFQLQIPKSTFTFTIHFVAHTALGTTEDRHERHLSFWVLRRR